MAIPYSRTIVGNLPWYSVLIVCGILLAVLLAEKEEKRLKLPKDTVLDLALVVVPCGIIGARLYYVAMSWDQFSGDPISALYIWEGGVAIYGAVIGGILGALVYAKRKKLNVLTLLDVLVPGVLLAQALGRWGNYFNMEAYGPEIHNALFWFFPAGVLIPMEGGYVWHMATFFYESLWNALGTGALWLLRKRQKQPGNLFCWYLLIYGSGRFIIEQLREDSLYLWGFRASRMLSLILCTASGAVLLYRAWKDRKNGRLLCLGALLMLILRWFCLDVPWAYGAAVAVAALLCLACCHAEKLRPTGGQWLWLGAVLLSDAAGLVFSFLPTPMQSFAGRLHTLLCSVTLPLMVGWLVNAADTKDVRRASHAHRDL